MLAPEGMNSIVLGERRGSGQESATTQEVCLSGIFIYLLSYYICNGLFFLFSVCWLHMNEFNSFLGGIKGEKSEGCGLF